MLGYIPSKNIDQIQEVEQPQAINEMDWIIKPIQDPKTKILRGGIAISNIFYTKNKQQIRKQNFKGVLSICGDKLDISVETEHLWIHVSDKPSQTIDIFFQSSYNFIDKHVQNGNVLVHCQAGVSRSASFVIAYLIRKNRMTYENAFQIVNSGRPIIQPNKGFERQLKKYAKQPQNKEKKSWFSVFCLS